MSVIKLVSNKENIRSIRDKASHISLHKEYKQYKNNFIEFKKSLAKKKSKGEEVDPRALMNWIDANKFEGYTNIMKSELGVL